MPNQPVLRSKTRCAVYVEARDRVGLSRRDTLGFVDQVVTGVVESCARDDMPEAATQRHAQGRNSDESIAVDARRIVEEVVLTLEPVLDQVVPTPGMKVQFDVRQLSVGAVGRRDGSIDGLELLHARECTPAFPGVVEIAALHQVAQTRGIQAIAEILQILIIRDRCEIDRARPARAEPPGLLDPHRTARAELGGATVLGQHLGVDLHLLKAIEITQLRAQHQAACAHDARGDGRVDVRRDIPIVGDADVGAGRVGRTEARDQKSAATPIVDRKEDVGCVEDRNLADADSGMMGVAHPAFLIELEIARLDRPIRVAGRAGGVGDVAIAALLLGEDLGLLGSAEQIRAAGEAIARGVDRALSGQDVVIGFVPLDAQPAASRGRHPRLRRADRCVDRRSIDRPASVDRPARRRRRRAAG